MHAYIYTYMCVCLCVCVCMLLCLAYVHACAYTGMCIIYNCVFMSVFWNLCAEAYNCGKKLYSILNDMLYKCAFNFVIIYYLSFT